jgi:hypothetical protein
VVKDPLGVHKDLWMGILHDVGHNITYVLLAILILLCFLFSNS